MMLRLPAEEGRQLKTVRLDADLAVVGGGMAGVCCAITAARAGIRVVLVQDRPVLGGNASSEVRLWVLGATSHMGNNNRWAREGGVVDELLVENAYRNPEGNPVLLDALLLDKVTAEPNLTLLLNTAVYEVEKHDAETIRSVRAFCSQNSTLYIVDAPLFCDASGDGVLGFLAGAAFRVGSESRDELGEALAPVKPNGDLLGHSLFFYTKDTGRPVQFVPPHFALDDIRRIPRYRRFNSREHGCQLWWIEYGGRLDTVHETETIKWELWKIVYGVWNHIKNSGEFPEAKTMTLEWVGMIPGKRESRRFEGDYMLTQQDLVEQRPHDDAVSYGGWAIDLHPADGVYSPDPGCAQWHTKGVYPIPFRSLYSRNIKNLFLAGRIISASHVAFGSTRVMATCAHNAQAVGMAAALCRRETLRPADLVEPGRMHRLQRQLLRAGQFIPGLALGDPEDLARSATLSPSSRLRLGRLPADGPGVALAEPRAMLLPMPAGPMPRVTFTVDVHQPTMLHVELRASQRPGNFTPDVTLATQTIRLLAGENQVVVLDFETRLDRAQYVFVCLPANPQVVVRTTTRRITGVLSAAQHCNRAVATSSVQQPPPDSGIDRFEFWHPERRPGGQNLALSIAPPLDVFGAESLTNGIDRPTERPNAWVADFDDPAPTLTLRWAAPQTIGRIELLFDTDFDHPLESVLMGHPERVMPFCVRQFRVLDGRGQVLAECSDNHQTRRTLRIEPAVTTAELRIELTAPCPQVPASLFAVRCFESSR
jgi:hypothetical protein